MWLTRSPSIQLAIYSTATPTQGLATFAPSVQTSVKSDRAAKKSATQPIAAPEGGFARRIILYRNGPITVAEARDPKIVRPRAFLAAQAGLQSLVGSCGSTVEAALQKRVQGFWHRPWVAAVSAALKSGLLAAGACTVAAVLGATTVAYICDVSSILTTCAVLVAVWPYILTAALAVAFFAARKAVLADKDSKQVLADFRKVRKAADEIEKEASAVYLTSLALEAKQAVEQQAESIIKEAGKISALGKQNHELTSAKKKANKAFWKAKSIAETFAERAKLKDQDASCVFARTENNIIEDLRPRYESILHKYALDQSLEQTEEDAELLDEFALAHRRRDTFSLEPGFIAATQAKEEFFYRTDICQRACAEVDQLGEQKKLIKAQRQELAGRIRYAPSLYTKAEFYTHGAVEQAAIALGRPTGSISEAQVVNLFSPPDAWLARTFDKIFLLERSLSLSTKQAIQGQHPAPAARPKHPLIQAAFDDLLSVAAHVRVDAGTEPPGHLLALASLYFEERFLPKPANTPGSCRLQLPEKA